MPVGGRAAAWLLALAVAATASAQTPPAPTPLPSRAIEAHAGAANGAVFTPDGLQILSVGVDQEAKLFDMATGELLRSFVGHTGPIYSLAVSPDGRLLATGAQDNTLRVWDVPQLRPITAESGHEGAVAQVARSIDGAFLVSVGADRKVRLWPQLPNQAPTAEMATPRGGHAATSTSVAVRGDGALFASGDEAGNVLLWSPYLQQPQRALGAHLGAVRSLVFLGDNARLATSGDDGALKQFLLNVPPSRQWAAQPSEIRGLAVAGASVVTATGAEGKIRTHNLADGQLVRELAGQAQSTALAVTPNNQLVAVSDESGRVQFRQLSDGADRLSVAGHEAAIRGVAVHPDNLRLATAGDDGTVRVWETPAPLVLLNGHTAAAVAAAVRSDGTLWATVGVDKTVRLWGPAGEVVRSLALTDPGQSVAFATDQQAVLGGDAAGRLQAWNVGDGAATATIGAHSAGVLAIVPHPTLPLVATAGADGSVKSWRWPPVAPRVLTGHAQPVTTVAVAVDGAWSATGGADQTVRIWDSANGQAARTLDAQTLGPVRALAAQGAAENSQLAAGGELGVVAVWNPLDGQERWRWTGPETAADELAYSIDGARLAVAGRDQVVRVVAAPIAARPLWADPTPTRAAAVSPDGTRLALATAVGERPAIVLRDVATGQVAATLLGHEGAVVSLAFHAGGNLLISGAEDKTARVWRLDDPKFPEVARFGGHVGTVGAVAIAPDGKSAYSSGAENSIHQWQIADGAELRAIAGHGQPVTALSVSATELWSGSADGTARSWRLADGAAVRTINHGAAIAALALAPDGKSLLTAGADKSIKAWNAANGAAGVVATLATSPATALRVGGGMFAAVAADGVRLFGADGIAWERWPAAAPVVAAEPLADGALLVVGADGSVMRRERQVVATISGLAAAPHVAFLPDGSLLVAADKNAQVWSLSTGKPAPPLPGLTAAVHSVSVSQDGLRIAAACEDKRVVVWQAGKPGPALTLAAPARDVLVLGDGRIAACGDDMRITLWDGATGAELERLEGHTTPVLALAASGDGATVVSSGPENTARVWTPALDRVLESAKSPPGAPLERRELAVSGAGEWCAALDAQVALWNPQTGERRAIAVAAARLAARGGAQQLVTADAQGKLQVWDLESAKPQTEIMLGAACVDLEYSPDGTRLLAATSQSTRVYDATTFKLREEAVSLQPIRSLAVAANNRSLLVVGELSNTPGLQRLSLLQVLDAHPGGAADVLFLPDQQHLASCGADGRVVVWRLEDGAAVRELAPAGPAQSALAIGSNGQWLASAGRGAGIRLWQWSDGTLVTTLAQEAPVRSLALSNDGLWVAVAEEEGPIRVWDRVAGRLGETFELPSAVGQPAPPAPQGAPGKPLAARVVRFLPDNRTLVAGAADGGAHVLPLSIERVVAAHAPGATYVSLLGGLLATSGADGVVAAWGQADGQRQRLFQGPPVDATPAAEPGAPPPANAAPSPARIERPTCVAARPDNGRVAAAGDDGRILVWEANNQSLLVTLEGVAPVLALAYSPDGQRLAAVDAEGLRIFGPPPTPQQGVELVLHQTIPAPGLRHVTFIDNRWLATGDAEGRVARWLYASPVALRSLGHGGPVYAAAFTPDGRTLVSCGADQLVRIWDVETGNQRAQLNGHQGPVLSLAVSPDGALAVSSGADNTLRLWDLAGGRQLKQLVNGQESLYTVAFHPLGKLVAAAGADRKVYVFDVVTGAQQRALEGHRDYVHRVQFNNAGTRLLSYGYAGDLFVWNLADGKPALAGAVGRVGNTVVYSPTGDQLLTACGDGTLHLVPLPEAAR